MGVTHAMYLLRQVGIYYNRMNHGNFNFEESTLSREIFNCTVGLIGGGHIGGATAQIYSALGAKVLLFDPYYDAALEPFVEYTDLDTIFKNLILFPYTHLYFQVQQILLTLNLLVRWKNNLF